MKTYKVVLKDCTWHTYTVQADNEDEAEINAITTFSSGDNGKEESELTVESITKERDF